MYMIKFILCCVWAIRRTENIPKWFCKIMKYDQSTIKYPWLITAQEGLDQETSFS